MADNQFELPKAVVKRIIKEKLQTVNANGQKKDVVLQKDVLLAVTESAKVFLNYVTSTANDICQEGKRQTISANDVLQALEEIEFTEMVEPLKEALAVYKQQTQEKNKLKAEASKKRKSQDAAAAEGADTTAQQDTDPAAAADGAKEEAAAAKDSDADEPAPEEEQQQQSNQQADEDMEDVQDDGV